MIFYYKKLLLLIPLFYSLATELINFFKYDGLSSKIGVTNLKIMFLMLLITAVLLSSLYDNLKIMLDKEINENKAARDKKFRRSTVKEGEIAPPCGIESVRKSTRTRKQPKILAKELTGKVHPLFKLSTNPLKLLVDDNETTVS